MEKIRGCIEILRPVNALVAGLASVIAAGIAAGSLSPPMLILAVIVFLITGAGNAINDYFDAAIDRINRPDRPIPSGRISPGEALAIASFLFLAGNMLSLFTNPLCLGIALFNSLVLVLYASSLKKTILLGNVAVAYLSASIFLFGGAFQGFEGFFALIPLAAITMSAMLSRELLKDVEDMEGDTADGARTLPIRFGVKATCSLALFFVIIAVIASLFPFSWWGTWYLAGIVPVDLLILIAAALPLHCSTHECVKRSGATRYLKYGMFASLLVFIVFGILIP